LLEARRTDGSSLKCKSRRIKYFCIFVANPNPKNSFWFIVFYLVSPNIHAVLSWQSHKALPFSHASESPSKLINRDTNVPSPSHPHYICSNNQIHQSHTNRLVDNITTTQPATHLIFLFSLLLLSMYRSRTAVSRP